MLREAGYIKTRNGAKRMKTKIFIDGSEGTTGLRIDERFQERDDVEILKIDSEKRKDASERKKLINASDITFLCLPDAAAKESVALVENENVCIIDTSTAHRTEEGWAYGFPELSAKHREKVVNGKRIAVPGCHATGFISMVYPLIAGGILPKDYPVASFSLTGYSGGGKKTIAAYADANRPKEFDSAREYALSQQHKHLKEMQKITGLERAPLFSPVIDDYYSGMVVSLPLYTDMLTGSQTPESLQKFFVEYYQGQKFIQVCDLSNEVTDTGFLSGNGLSGWDGLKLYVTGNEERVVVSAQFDNLGKGASGAAIQCMNLVLGCEEEKGLNLK
jgi:N-acetyl-gamma-glutamyl-phosphate reductase